MLVAAGLSDRTLVANANGTGFRRVPLVASPIETGGVVADGGEGVGEGTVDIGSRVLALMMAGESRPLTGNVGSLDATSGGLSFFSGLVEAGITFARDGTGVNADMSESGSLSPLTFFAPIVLCVAVATGWLSVDMAKSLRLFCLDGSD